MGIYVRKDIVRGGRTYYWLVASYREGGKVVQKRLKYLGTKEPTAAQVEAAKQEVAERLGRAE